MHPNDLSENPHLFWQAIEPAGTFDLTPDAGHSDYFPVRLANNHELALPIRQLSDGQSALASLIINQASFAVADTLAEILTQKVRPLAPEIVVGLPTLGLTLAALVAQKLGHTRYVPLSTSRKFWYVEDLSVPMRSITSPDQQKHLYLDPRMLPLLEGRRILLIDDVISSGTSMASGIKLLQVANCAPSSIGAAMLQTRRSEPLLKETLNNQQVPILSAFETPLLSRKPNQGPGWYPAD